jgi:small subunit ribosomal protein S16
MLAIRLARFGSKKKPTYRVVVINKTNPRDGRAVEIVGHYNPVAQPTELKLKHDRIEHWIKCGAQPSDTVKRLMKAQPAEAVAESAPSV